MHLRALAETPLRRRLHHLVLALDAAGGLPLARLQRLGAEVGPLTWLDLQLQGLHPGLGALVEAFQVELCTLAAPAQAPDGLAAAVRALRARRRGDLSLVLPLDGLQRTQDRLHGAGAWDRTWALYDELRPLAGLRLEFRTRLRADNAEEILALAQYLRQQKADGHAVAMAIDPDPRAAPPALDRLTALEAPLFALLDGYTAGDTRLQARLRRNFHRLAWSHARRSLEEGRQVIPCLAGLAHGVVHADGRVSACALLPPVGNLRDRTWAELWGGEALAAQRQHIAAGTCHCVDDRALHDSILLRPQSLPALLATS